MTQLAEKTPLQHLAEDESLKQVWDKRYPASKRDNPLPAIGADLAQKNPSLTTLHFMREILAIHLKALSRIKQQDPETRALFLSLQAQNDALIGAQPLPPLNPQQAQFIGALKHKLADENYNAARSAARLVSAGMRRAFQEAKDHPRTAAAFLAPAVLSLYWIQNRIGSSGYVEPEMLALKNLSMDDAFSDAPVSVDLQSLNAIDPTQRIAEHSNLQSLLGIDHETAQALLDNPIISTLFPEHGFRLNTFVYDAQSDLVSVYEGLYGERYQFGLYESTANLGSQILPHGEAFEAYTQGAQAATTLWTNYDWVENIAIHPPITIFTAIATAKLGSMNAEEWQEFKADVKNTGQFLIREEPLALAFATASAAGVGIYNESLHPAMIWAAITGISAGQFVQHKLRRSRIGDFLSVQGHDLKDALDTKIIAPFKASEALPRPHDGFLDMLRSDESKAFAILSAGAIALDSSLNGGQLTMGGLGASVATVKFWMINAVQEVGLHGVFAAAGVALGSTWAAGARLKRRVWPRQESEGELTPAAQSAYTPG